MKVRTCDTGNRGRSEGHWRYPTVGRGGGSIRTRHCCRWIVASCRAGGLSCTGLVNLSIWDRDFASGGRCFVLDRCNFGGARIEDYVGMV